jgi:hypothetical protein
MPAVKMRRILHLQEMALLPLCGPHAQAGSVKIGVMDGWNVRMKIIIFLEIRKIQIRQTNQQT